MKVIANVRSGNEVVLEGPFPEEARRLARLIGMGKFVVAEKDGDRFVLFFSPTWVHADEATLLVEKGFNFLAAGSWSVRGGVRFGSKSCQKSFGFDAPSDDGEREEILSEIVEVLESIPDASA